MKNLAFIFLATCQRGTAYETNTTTVTRLASHWQRTRGLGLPRDFEDVSQQDPRNKILDRSVLDRML